MFPNPYPWRSERVRYVYQKAVALCSQKGVQVPHTHRSPHYPSLLLCVCAVALNFTPFARKAQKQKFCP